MGNLLGGWLGQWQDRYRNRARRNADTQPPQLSAWQRLGRKLSKVILLLLVATLALILLLRWLPPPTSSIIAQHALQAFWQDIPLRHAWVALPDISPHAALAVIAAEDQRFPEHYGFDFIEMQQAFSDQDAGKSLRGASTLSQQTAKNLFLWSGRSWLRKGLEVWFTVWLELLWSKQRILEVYLNIAEFGEYTFGIEAASQRFFNKSAAALTPSEAARLAAVLPNPQRYRADKPSPYILKRQRWIEKQMRQLGGTYYLEKL